MMLMEFTSLLNCATVLVSLWVVFYFYARYKQTYWSRRGIYSPPAHWFFGHLKDAILMRASPPQVLGEIHKMCENHPVVGIYIFQKPFLLLRSPEAMKKIFIKDFHVFPDRYFAAKQKTDIVGSAGLFSIDNPEWKYLRMKLSPAFTTGKVKNLFSLMLESAKHMKSYLKAQVTDDQKVNLEVRRIASKYTTDVISSLTFGITTNSFDEPDPEFYVRSRAIFDQSISRTLILFITFFFPKLIDILGITFVGKHTDFFRKIFWESMNAREKSGMKRGDIIDLLLDLKNEKQSSEFKFEGDYLLAQSIIFFTAGLETSAVTMSFTLFELSKHPDIQEKIRDEIREKIGNEKLTYERISEMNYLNQVVSETLRLYPPAPIIDRIAVDDYKIPDTNIVIEKGTVVYATLKGVHEDPEYHPDPQIYDPDRFSETRKKDIKPCTYMPFGDGPRNCIGSRVGMLQTMVGLITILSEYEVSSNPNYKNEVSKRAIFIAPSNGINLYLKRVPLFT